MKKKKYMKPQTEVMRMNLNVSLLVGSPDTPSRSFELEDYNEEDA